MYQPSFIPLRCVDPAGTQDLPATLLSSASELLDHGHAVGAAAGLRVAIETWCRSQARRHADWGDRPAAAPFWLVSLFLVRRGVLKPADRHRLARIYRIASAIMHGRQATDTRLAELISDAAAIVEGRDNG